MSGLVAATAAYARLDLELSLYGKRGLEFRVIVVNFIAMVPGMSNSVRRDFEVLWLTSYQGNAFPTLIGFL